MSPGLPAGVNIQYHITTLLYSKIIVSKQRAVAASYSTTMVVSKTPPLLVIEYKF